MTMLESRTLQLARTQFISKAMKPTCWTNTVINNVSGTGVYQQKVTAFDEPSGPVLTLSQELIGFVIGINSASLTLTSSASFTTLT